MTAAFPYIANISRPSLTAIDYVGGSNSHLRSPYIIRHGPKSMDSPTTFRLRWPLTSS